MKKNALITDYDALAGEISKWGNRVRKKERKAERLSIIVRELRERLNVFSGEYYTRVGSYYARLDVIEIELNMYRHRLSRVSNARIESIDDVTLIENEVEEKYSKEHAEAKKRLHDTDEIGSQYRRSLSRQELFELLSEEKRSKIRALFRRLALLFHPDKAGSEEERIVFNGIMAEINDAYSQADLELLASFLERAERGKRIGPEDAHEKLARLKKEYARLDEIVKKLYNEKVEIESSELWKLKLKVEEARCSGSDLLAEMTRRAKNELKLKREMLDALIKEYRSVMNGIFEHMQRR
ncbi:MAG: hypothetical protein JW768_03100 [Chitinispirillaceae bacterium]|nr:hypothetical protein [Chitinispirillaceae bacterium]